MTAKAHEIGMMQSTFRNASGWPDPEHFTTAHDLARLALATIRNFPEYYHYYAELSYTYHDIKQSNRNPLLYKNIGADGLKTGHTEASGYGLTASAERNGRRLVMVANGYESEKARSDGGERLIDWGFREFENYALFKSGETVIDAQVWLGQQRTVAGVVEKGLTVTIPRKSRAQMKVAVQYEEPLSAPIAAGAQIGTVVITAPDVEAITLPVLAAQEVKQLGPMGRVGEALRHLVWGGGK